MKLHILLAWFCVNSAISAQGADDEARKTMLAAQLDREYSSLEGFYQQLHSNPELSFQEQQTAARVAAELKSAGFEVTTGIGGHGVVGVLKNGAGATVLVRTDLDALPVLEETGLPYASRVRAKDPKGNDVPVMHACGHDMHMAVFAGVGRMLAQTKKQWQGTVVMIGQPAEERGGGAKAMLKDGLFSRFPKPDYALALHVSPNLPAGSLGYVEGYALANVDSADIKIRGVGGHGAWPHTAKDPIILAAQTILALQTIVSREIPPGEPAVVTVGSIHGGTKHNIIPEEVHLQLTLRSYSEEVRNQTMAAVKRITHGLAVAAGLPQERMPEITFGEDHTPATFNDPKLTRRLATVFQSWFGPGKVREVKPVMGSEDFGLYGRTSDAVPICMFWLGSIPEKRLRESERGGKPLPSLHSSVYHPQVEPTLKTGVTAMTIAVLDLLGNK